MAEQDWPGRWAHLRKLLERTGPFAHPDFEPSPEVRRAKDEPFLSLCLQSLYVRNLSGCWSVNFVEGGSGLSTKAVPRFKNITEMGRGSIKFYISPRVFQTNGGSSSYFHGVPSSILSVATSLINVVSAVLHCPTCPREADWKWRFAEMLLKT